VENEILIVEKQENVCTLLLNRPEKRNSLTQDLLIRIYEVLTELSKDDSIRTVVIRGYGNKAFCSGYDIRSLPSKVNPEIQEQLLKQNPLEMALESIINYPYPVIAMLNGFAFGAGCELAVCCDFRIAREDIKIGMPPAKIGIVYPPAGIQRFIDVIGLRSTKEMFFTGSTFSGQKLRGLGIVDYLIPKDELESYTYGLAETLAGNAPLALKGTKKIINMLLAKSQMGDKESSEAESLLVEAFLSEDLKEGQLAFLEKRTPKFSGK